MVLLSLGDLVSLSSDEIKETKTHVSFILKPAKIRVKRVKGMPILVSIRLPFWLLPACCGFEREFGFTECTEMMSHQLCFFYICVEMLLLRVLWFVASSQIRVRPLL